MLRGFINILTTNAGVQAEAGQNKAASKYKVYPLLAGSRESLPYYTARIIGRDPIDCKVGAIGSSIYRVELSAISREYDDTQLMHEAAISALQGIDGTYDTIEFQQIRFANERDEVQEYGGDYIYLKISEWLCTVD